MVTAAVKNHFPLHHASVAFSRVTLNKTVISVQLWKWQFSVLKGLSMISTKRSREAKRATGVPSRSGTSGPQTPKAAGFPFNAAQSVKFGSLNLPRGLWLWAGFAFFIHIKEESSVAASYWNSSCITSNGGWVLKCVGFLNPPRTSGTLWVRVINSRSFKSSSLTDIKLCFMLSVDFQDLAELSKEMGFISNRPSSRFCFQRNPRVSGLRVLLQTQTILPGLDKKKKKNTNNKTPQNQLQFAQTVCKTEGKKLSWTLSSWFSALKHILLFPFNGDI